MWQEGCTKKLTQRLLRRGRRGIIVLRFGARRKVLYLVLTGVLASKALPVLLHSDSSSSTILAVNVLPDVRLEARPAGAWSPFGELQQLTVPIDVQIRLNAGTAAEISILEANSSAAAVELKVDGGWQPVSDTPLVISTHSASGFYAHTLLFRRSASDGSGSQPVSLLLRVASNDGSVDLAQSLDLPN